MKTKKPDKEWRERLNEQGFTRNYPFANKELEPLKKKLLRMGGWAVILPDKEQDLEEHLNRGIKFSGKSILKLGEPCQCHYNTSKIWHETKGEIKICTGYALSADGVWRVHTWGIQKTKNKIKIIETTEKRLLYYGYVLSRIESDIFSQIQGVDLMS